MYGVLCGSTIPTNSSIERIAGLWQLHQVKSIKATNEYFFGSNGLPAGVFSREMEFICRIQGQNDWSMQSAAMWI